MAEPKVIVVGNEKGGAGKSTIAIHLAAGLLHAGARLAVVDLDLRQQSTARFFANRAAWLKANGKAAPLPVATPLAGVEGMKLAKMSDEDTVARLNEAMQSLAGAADVVLIDTPGGDTATSRTAHGMADLIVTPMNDSFVDFDMLGVVDPVTLELKRPSLYAETVWNSRKVRAATNGRSIDWVVLRNRLAPTEARNRKRVDERVQALSKRIGFRVGPGLRDRVIYRELFPFGLTIADLSTDIRPIPVSLQHVAARQELRSLVTFLGLGGLVGERLIAAE